MGHSESYPCQPLPAWKLSKDICELKHYSMIWFLYFGPWSAVIFWRNSWWLSTPPGKKTIEVIHSDMMFVWNGLPMLYQAWSAPSWTLPANPILGRSLQNPRHVPVAKSIHQDFSQPCRPCRPCPRNAKMALIQPCQAMWAMCLAINLFLVRVGIKAENQPWHWNMLPYLNRIWWTLQMRQGWAKVCQWLSMFVCKKHSDYTTLTTWPHWIPLVPKDTKGTLDSMGTVRRPLVSPWKDAKAISGPWCTCCNRGLALHALPWYVPLHSLPMFSNV